MDPMQQSSYPLRDDPCFLPPGATQGLPLPEVVDPAQVLHVTRPAGNQQK